MSLMTVHIALYGESILNPKVALSLVDEVKEIFDTIKETEDSLLEQKWDNSFNLIEKLI